MEFYENNLETRNNF